MNSQLQAKVFKSARRQRHNAALDRAENIALGCCAIAYLVLVLVLAGMSGVGQ